jgi:CheY-like chemotaxis protein
MFGQSHCLFFGSILNSYLTWMLSSISRAMILCRNLMLIDDDLEDIEIFKEAIKNIDPLLSVTDYCTCQDAIDFLKKETSNLPDLIFLDLNLPGMTGLQCLSELRNIQSIRYIPIIIYTTSKYYKDIEDTFKLGASYFLTKPGKSKVLDDALARLLRYYPTFVYRLRKNRANLDN